MRGLQNSARAAAVTTEEEGKDDNNEEVENDEVCGPTVQMSMGFQDLATVMNGKHDNEIENKPINKYFT